MKKLTKIIGIILFLSLFSCEKSMPDSSSINLQEMRMGDEGQQLVATKNNIQPERKIIKTGEVEFETEDLKKTRTLIFKVITKHNAYSSSDNEYRFSNTISNKITIRVPSNNFDKLLNDLTIGVDKFDRKEINMKDVSAEFLDIEARLKTKKELELRYLDILKKANTVTEILAVEKQVGELRSDIESIEGRFKFLNNQISFSTLNVRVYQTLSKKTAFGKKFTNGIKNGWNNLIHFFIFIVSIWPFILISIGVLVLIRFWRKKRTKKS